MKKLKVWMKNELRNVLMIIFLKFKPEKINNKKW